MAPGALAQVLGDLPNVHNDNLLVGFDTSDDASVFRVGDNLGLVQSIDFFPPMVDDPFLFGQMPISRKNARVSSTVNCFKISCTSPWSP